jgi:triphosphatase
MPNTNRPVETELKLAVSPAAEKSLSQFAPFRSSAAGKPKSQRILTTYFDTPKYDLDRLGLSLRVRRVGHKRLQTVKTTGDHSAAKVRGEWEWPVVEDAPNLELARQASIEPAIPEGIDDSLAPVVTTDVVRTTRVVNFEGGTVEVALDTGSIAAGEARTPIHELELELHEGAPSAVFRMALALHAATPVAIEAESKVSRGLRLRRNAGPSAREASPPEIDP